MPKRRHAAMILTTLLWLVTTVGAESVIPVTLRTTSGYTSSGQTCAGQPGDRARIDLPAAMIPPTVDHITGWRWWARALSANVAYMTLQLWHDGGMAHLLDEQSVWPPEGSPTFSPDTRLRMLTPITLAAPGHAMKVSDQLFVCAKCASADGSVATCALRVLVDLHIP